MLLKAESFGQQCVASTLNDGLRNIPTSDWVHNLDTLRSAEHALFFRLHLKLTRTAWKAYPIDAQSISKKDSTRYG